MTAEDLSRIEEKLDKIIRFFQIDQAPQRSKAELYQEIDYKLLRLQDLKKRRDKN